MKVRIAPEYIFQGHFFIIFLKKLTSFAFEIKTLDKFNLI